MPLEFIHYMAVDSLKANSLYVAFLAALSATLGSLVLSEVYHFRPCELCWYQRIMVYPMVLILPIGILTRDKKVYLYVLPLAVLGLAIALYHSLLQYGVIPQSIAPCAWGVSCTTNYFTWLGFITIPLMSFFSFLLIIICMLLYRSSFRERKD